jgi:hypothetical protein
MELKNASCRAVFVFFITVLLASLALVVLALQENFSAVSSRIIDVASYISDINLTTAEKCTSVMATVTRESSFQHAHDTLPENREGKNWSIAKCFATSPSDEELSRLLPDLIMRKFRLMYLLNPATGVRGECLVSWNNGTWQHEAVMILQHHAMRALYDNKSTGVGRAVGYKWGFGSGISLLAKSIVPAVVNDHPV